MVEVGAEVLEEQLQDPASAGPGRKRVRLPRVRRRHGLPRRRSGLTRGAGIAGGAAVAGAVCAGLLMSMQSPLGIEEIEVTGAGPALHPQIVGAVGAAAGDSFASVDTDAAAARIAALDGVEGVEIGWSWWNTLAVRVQQQVPLAVIAAKDGFTVLDTAGNPIRQVAARPAGLPLLGPGGESLAVAVAVARQVPATLAVAAVDAPSADAVALTLASGTKVLLGSNGDLAAKIALAERLVPTGAAQINVSVPQRPTLTGLPEG